MFSTSRSAHVGVALAVAVAVASSSCSSGTTSHKAESPAKVAEIAGSKLKSVTLTQSGADRISLATASVTSAGGSRAIPYSAVLYDAAGKTWAYTTSEPLVFVRAPIAVERIDGDVALLSDGPAEGATVVSRGAVELYGAESGVGK